jgi:hypothetical protein
MCLAGKTKERVDLENMSFEKFPLVMETLEG